MPDAPGGDLLRRASAEVSRQQLGHHDPLKLMRYREPKVGRELRHGAQEIVGEAAQIRRRDAEHQLIRFEHANRDDAVLRHAALGEVRKDREAWGVEVLSQAPALRRTG